MSEQMKKSILIVDDENSNIAALTSILGASYTYFAAKNGRDAIAAAEKHKPDLILLDIIMPEMNGFDVIELLKKSEKTCNIPVIFITGLSNSGDEEKGLLLGATDYIIKPFFPAIVKLRVLNQIKIMEQMQVIMEKELIEKNNIDKINFLTQMSHDMFTPMNAIIGFTHILKTQCSANWNDTEKDYLDEIDNASQELQEMLKRLYEE